LLLHALRRLAASILRGDLGSGTLMEARALIDGIRLGEIVKRKGISIDLYRAPIVKIPLKDIHRFFIARRLVSDYLGEWFSRNIGSLTVED